jgi:hypothetical protein
MGRTDGGASQVWPRTGPGVRVRRTTQAAAREADFKVNWTGTIFEVIDMRSFSNLWYWIALAVVWSSASHYVMGVPFDMLQRARRHGGQAMADFEEIVRINVNRILHIVDVAGAVLLASWAFVLTTLIVLAFWYWIEFAQAVVMIAAPMTLVFALTVRMARRLVAEQPQGEALIRQFVRMRFWMQVIGMVAIFVTAMFGMYQNLSVIPF